MTTTSKTFAFRADNEFDSLVLSCEWTPELVALIKQRHAAVQVLAEAGDFNCASFFWYGLDCDQFPEGVLEDELEDDAPVLLDIEMPEMLPQRVDIMLMCVTKDCVYFRFALKHSNEYLEGGRIDLDDEDFFPTGE